MASCLVVACLLTITLNQGNIGQKAENRLDAALGTSGLVAHDSIFIDGDGALAAFCAGNGTNGTQSNPYIIQNYVINAPTAIGIYIENTNACLVIRNCVVDNGNGSEIGIYLENTSSVNVSNNTLSKIADGIGLESASNTTISGNNCLNNGDGIDLNGASNTTIAGNNCSSNSDGIFMSSANNNMIVCNNCSNNANIGIFLLGASKNTISGNNCPNNGYGICLAVYSNNNTVTGNNCSSNGEDGILLYGQFGTLLEKEDNNLIIGNNCTSNKIDGIHLNGGASNNTISGNNCSNNSDGIYLCSWSFENLIWGNNFFDNTEYQAVSDSPANQWYYNQTGNYYGDYLAQNPYATDNGRIWNTPYKITGSSDQDLYPLVNRAMFNFTTDLPIIILGGYNGPRIPPPPILAAIAPNPSTTGDITLTWKAIAGATSYQVYRSTNNITGVHSLTPIATVTQTTYQDTGLGNGTYYYVIVAVNGTGDSGISNCESVVVAVSAVSSSTPGFPVDVILLGLAIGIAGIVAITSRRLRSSV